jgi:hypothetical protein
MPFKVVQLLFAERRRALERRFGRRLCTDVQRPLSNAASKSILLDLAPLLRDLRCLSPIEELAKTENLLFDAALVSKQAGDPESFLALEFRKDRDQQTNKDVWESEALDFVDAQIGGKSLFATRVPVKVNEQARLS